MALFLVQHGKSLEKVIDPEEGLSEQGIADTQRIAEVAKGYQVNPSQIYHSIKKRAQQTAQIFQSLLNPEKGTKEIQGIKPMDNVVVFKETIVSSEQIMVVGHLPFLERLTSLLVTGDEDLLVFKFQNSGIVCLEVAPDNSSWYIKWALMPHIN